MEILGQYGNLTVAMPEPALLSAAKLVRGDPRDVEDACYNFKGRFLAGLRFLQDDGLEPSQCIIWRWQSAVVGQDRPILLHVRTSAVPPLASIGAVIRRVAMGQTAIYAVQQIPTTERKRSPSASRIWGLPHFIIFTRAARRCRAPMPGIREFTG